MPTLTSFPKILRFTGPHAFLSNFFPSRIPVRGVDYPTVEHAFQALKFESVEHQRSILFCGTPGAARKLGRRLSPLRPRWNADRIQVMRVLIRKKFSHPGFAAQLMDTGDAELEEGNTWNDTFWGISKGRGRNELGKLLMETRDLLSPS